MAQPKAYAPEQGYQYQILIRNQKYNGREWEHLDYSTDKGDKEELMTNYRMAYRGQGYEFNVILLPAKFWDKEKVEAYRKSRREIIHNKVLANAKEN